MNEMYENACCQLAKHCLAINDLRILHKVQWKYSFLFDILKGRRRSGEQGKKEEEQEKLLFLAIYQKA